MIASDLLRLLKVREFALLWFASTISLFGDGIYFVSIAWEVYRLSNVPTALGVVGAAFSLPQILFLLVGGVVSDRLDRRALMIVASLFSAVCIGAIGVLIEEHAIALWMIVALVAVYGTAEAFFLPASRAFIPTLVPAGLMSQAGAVEQFIQPLASSLVGPAVGGLIVALGGTGISFLIDAATFVIAAAALVFIKTRPAKTPVQEPVMKPSAIREARDALGFVRSQPWIWAGLIAAALANIALTGPQQVLVPYILKYTLHGGPRELGLVFAAGGAGGIATAIYVALRGTPRRNVTWIFTSWGFATLVIAALAVAGAPWQLAVLGFMISAGISFGNLIWFSMMGTLVPNRMLGRVSSLDFMISFSLTPLSNAATGPIATAIGARAVLIGAGLIAGLVTFAFLLVPHVRDPEEQTTAAAEPT